MTLQEHQRLMQELNQEYHEEMKPRLLGEQWRERQKKWLEIKKDQLTTRVANWLKIITSKLSLSRRNGGSQMAKNINVSLSEISEGGLTKCH